MIRLLCNKHILFRYIINHVVYIVSLIVIYNKNDIILTYKYDNIELSMYYDLYALRNLFKCSVHTHIR